MGRCANALPKTPWRSQRIRLRARGLGVADHERLSCKKCRGPSTTEAPARDALVERLKAIVPAVLESRLGYAPGDVAITINWQELRTLQQMELMVVVISHSRLPYDSVAGLRGLELAEGDFGPRFK
jgi:hypothetical protein